MLLDLVQRHGIQDGLDHSRIIGQHQYPAIQFPFVIVIIIIIIIIIYFCRIIVPVRPDPERDVLRVPDALQHEEDLVGEQLLA